MNFQLTNEQSEVQNWARAFAREVIAPRAEEHAREKIKRETLEKLSKEGFMTMRLPESLGGLGLDPLSYALVMLELSKVCASTGVTVSVTNMVADIVNLGGTEFHRREFLSRLVSGEALTASFCLTENSAGSDAGSLKSTATKRGDHYILQGEKIYVTNGAFSDFFLVMARTGNVAGSKGVSAFLVSRKSPGFQIGKEEDKMGLTGSSTIRLALDQVSVPESHRVGAEGEGLKVALRALDGGRIAIGAQALGIAKAALDAGLKYSLEREAFGKPISEFQAIQWKLADAATKIAAAELLILRAAWQKSRSMPCTKEASMAKLYASEMALQVCEEMLQIHGGYGYIKDYPAERFLRDVRVTSLYEGTSEIQRYVIARELLS